MTDLAGVACAKHAEIAATLGRCGWVVVDGYLEAATLLAWRQAAEARHGTPDFRPARVGRGDGRTLAPGVRSDRICWLEPDEPGVLGGWFTAMDDLRQAINRELYLGLWDYEAHLAVFPPGAFYARHLDQFAGAGDRLVSTVLYLNPHWPRQDGGELRLYDPDQVTRESGRATEPPDLAGARPYLDLAPVGGRLLVFLADRFEHEVRPGANTRYSLTGWFRRRAI